MHQPQSLPERDLPLCMGGWLQRREGRRCGWPSCSNCGETDQGATACTRLQFSDTLFITRIYKDSLKKTGSPGSVPLPPLSFGLWSKSLLTPPAEGWGMRRTAPSKRRSTCRRASNVQRRHPGDTLCVLTSNWGARGAGAGAQQQQQSVLGGQIRGAVSAAARDSLDAS